MRKCKVFEFKYDQLIVMKDTPNQLVILVLV